MTELTEIQRIIRAISRQKQGERQACFVCNKHRFITELHHIIPVKEIALYIHETGKRNHPMPMVWLCPNHHAYWHKLEGKSDNFGVYLHLSLEEEEAKFLELKRLQLEALANFHGVSPQELEMLG